MFSANAGLLVLNYCWLEILCTTLHPPHHTLSCPSLPQLPISPLGCKSPWEIQFDSPTLPVEPKKAGCLHQSTDLLAHAQHPSRPDPPRLPKELASSSFSLFATFAAPVPPFADRDPPAEAAWEAASCGWDLLASPRTEFWPLALRSDLSGVPGGTNLPMPLARLCDLLPGPEALFAGFLEWSDPLSDPLGLLGARPVGFLGSCVAVRGLDAVLAGEGGAVLAGEGGGVVTLLPCAGPS